MRVRIPGETRREYRYLLGLTLSQIIFFLIGGALSLQVYKSPLSLAVKGFLWGILALFTVLIAFVRWPLHGGESLWVWGIRWMHFLLLGKRWTYGPPEQPVVPVAKKAPVPIPKQVSQPLVTPIHPFSGPSRIARGANPLVAEVGDLKLYFTYKGRDVFVTIQQIER